ncbi:MAG: thiamine pyrophosphate-binding protein [Clostridiales bacterium]|jgi:acetolactate synthase-1/2/3 large subunit|nr:thiamine pyrophosphate-binding protein [Clostridiales bacterium]
MVKVSDYVMKFIHCLGVDHIFMLAGGGSMHLNDSADKVEGLSYVCCLHEQACAIAAESYARARNSMGAALLTTGPGSTNALTGVASAYMDSIPVIYISGQVKRADMINGQGVRQMGLQEIDIIPIVRPVTKYAETVMAPEDLKYHLERAAHAAREGRPGPAWLSIPLDIQAAFVEESGLVGFEGRLERKAPSDKELDEIISLYNSSERPVLIGGGGVRLADAGDAFLELASELGIPVLLGWNGADLMESDNPRNMGRFGAVAPRYSNFAVQNADFILSIGTRMDMQQTGFNYKAFGREACHVMVDIDPNEMKKANVSPRLAIQADAKEFLSRLLARKGEFIEKDRSGWLEACREWKRKYPVIKDEYKAQAGGVNSYLLIGELSEQMDEGDQLIPGSSGSCMDVAMQAFSVKRGQRLFASPGMASMGFGLPAGIGACIGAGRRTVVVNGDGGLQMNIQELETLRRLGLPVKLFVLNNNGYGAIRSTQTSVFGGHFVGCDPGSGVTLPNLEKIAFAYGLRYERIEGHPGLHEGVRRVLDGDDPAICEVMVSEQMAIAPKQASFKNKSGQMESLPIEEMNPPLEDSEMDGAMIVPRIAK